MWKLLSSVNKASKETDKFSLTHPMTRGEMRRRSVGQKQEDETKKVLL